MSKVRILPSIVQAFLFPAILLTSFRSEALRVVRFSKIGGIPDPFSCFLALNTRFLDWYVGEFSTSQKQAAITLIERKGRDKRLVKNWGPISLMNADTKIASRVIALRMKRVLPNIINYDQTVYVENRYILESIRVIDDILYHAEQENLDGILFAADMKKAFDSLEHNFIFSTLTRLGFCQQFIGPFAE